MKEEKKTDEVKTPKKEKSSSKVKALKDFKFSFNGKVYDLKEGEDVEVPEMFLQNLKTEKVIK